MSAAVVLRLEKHHLCRCCHSEGSFKSLYSRCFWLGVEEVAYNDILRECFDIELTEVTELVQDLLCTICDSCIQRLQESIIFKHQIKKCERTFKKIYLGECLNGAEPVVVTVKAEIPDPEDDQHDSILRTALTSRDNEVNVGTSTTEDENNLLVERDNNQNAEDNDFDWPMDEEPCNEGQPMPLRFEEAPAEKKAPIQKETRKKPKKKEAKSTKIKKEVIEEEESLKEDAESSKEEAKTEEPAKDDAKKKAGNKWSNVRLQENIHYKRLYKQSKLIYQCCDCDKQYKRLYVLRIHIKKNHLKLYEYHCELCDKMFATPAPYLKHKLDEHNVDERFKCNACEVVLYSKANLKKHMEHVHMLAQKHKCDSCGYDTYCLETLKRHILYKHKNIRNHHCAYCKKSFKTKSNLRLHEKIHTGDRNKVCKVCGEAFVQKSSLNYHMTKCHSEVN